MKTVVARAWEWPCARFPSVGYSHQDRWLGKCPLAGQRGAHPKLCPKCKGYKVRVKITARYEWEGK